VRAALGDSAGDRLFNQASHSNSGMSSLIPSEGPVDGRIEVRMMTADQVVADDPDAAPTVIKIDVEGAEDLVLRGAASLLAAASLRGLVLEADHGAAGRPMNASAVKALTAAGFTLAPLGRSDAHVEDRKLNFVATRA